MKTFTLDRDLDVICMAATSFPEGVLAAHQRLHALVTFTADRNYFGISYPNAEGQILYKAATEVLNPHEFTLPGCEPFTIRKGCFAEKFIPNFTEDVSVIGRTFQELLRHPRLDPQGYCLEWYVGERDVRCLVTLLD